MSTDASSQYLSPAFYSQYNLILLGGSALFALASASPWPAVFGVAAELCWLGFGPRLPAFRRHIDDRLASERRSRLDDEVLHGLRTLSAEHSARLAAVTEAISSLTEARAAVEDPGERAALLELEELRPAFMRMCQLRERLQQRLEDMRLSPPEHEVAELSRAYAAEKELGQRFTLHQAIKLAQKKVEHRQRLGEVRRQVEAKLALVEQSLSRVRHQQQQGLAGPELARELQAVMTHVLLLPALEAELEP